ncbi:uncharacterized protein LOC122510272 [Leptopilina heterotoma]|uniref:uncharacterized protein LOC122510272 n=1 Tax=Leptopilina heterotoma TaxID=63436 RepID=UPI001CA8C415|nr:uncharacterized protein LOC122510272 [Leptopilina heterotoma]
MAISISVGIECLALTTMLQIYGQLKINIHRLKLLSKLSKEINNNYNEKSPMYDQEEYTKNCIKHHHFIYVLGKNLNKQFGFVVFSQFFASSINICAIIFNLSKVNLNSRIGSIMISAAATYFFQIFIYCYYGDLVRRKVVKSSYSSYNLLKSSYN